MQAIEPPLYNSRIIQTYIEYLRANHPHVELDKILHQANMSKDEVVDTAHWFTQAQADRFYEELVVETGDANIARRAGRFVASAQGLRLIKQYVIGFMSLERVFSSMTKIIPMVTRGATVDVRRMNPGRIEIRSTPNPGVNEKYYQCENRMGYFEALPKLFTNQYAKIEHPVCLHRGGSYCQYFISWKTSLSLKLKYACNYSLIGSIILLIALFFSPTAFSKSGAAAILIGLNMLLTIAYAYQKIKEQGSVIESMHKLAEETIDSAKVNYNNALLVQNIGQETAALFDIHDLLDTLALLMKKHLAFDRGVILLADVGKNNLLYSTGYGYDEDEKQHLEHSVFHLDNSNSNCVFNEAFLDQKSVVVDNIYTIADKLSAKCIKLVQVMDARSFLCVPIVYEKKSLGILVVDNVHSMAPLKKSDVNLLEGIASHFAICINNTNSFQKLKESEARYRQTLESIADGYFEIDRSSRITFVNHALCQLLGYKNDELLGKGFDRYFISDTSQQIGPLFEGIQKGRRAAHFASFTMIKKGGSLIPVDLSASMVLDTSDQPLGFRGIIRDSTERLKIEKERQLLEKQFIQAQKMESIAILAGGIVHNFNNWLNGILGNIELIRLNSQQDEKIIEKIRNIESIIESAARMNQQLLGYARKGKYKLDLIDMNTVIKDSSDAFSLTRKDITTHLKLDPNVRAVKADKSQMEQILWNLYVNAVDAMPDGGRLTIETRNTTSEELKGGDYEIKSGNYISFSVSDTGSGIDAEHLKHIFEPFFTTKKGRGTGLGLASVYGIVKSHGGYVDLKSSVGKGSTFSVYLPSDKENYSNELRSENNINNPGSEKILFVDDDPMILDTCSQLLEQLGYTIVTAQSGIEALEIYAGNGDSIDIVIIDMVMPGMSGKELFYHLKQINPEVKTLLSSGYSMNEQVQNIINDGCGGFIKKPFKITKLTQMIREILSSTIS